MKAKMILSYMLIACFVLAVGLIGNFVLMKVENISFSGIDSLEEMVELENNNFSVQVSFKTQVQEWKNILLRGNT